MTTEENPRQDADRFDKDALLTLIDGDRALLTELLTAASDLKDRIEILGAAVLANDERTVRQTAHTIKGAALSLTFNRLARLAKRLEEGASADCSGLRPILRDMAAEWAELEKLIASELG